MHLATPYFSLRDLAHDHVVLVVAGHRDHEVGALDAGPLEHEELGGVAVADDVLEPLLEPGVALAVVLEQRHLVAHLEQRARKVRAHLAATRDQDVHAALPPRLYAARPGFSQMAWKAVSITAEVAHTVCRPSVR